MNTYDVVRLRQDMTALDGSTHLAGTEAVIVDIDHELVHLEIRLPDPGFVGGASYSVIACRSDEIEPAKD